MLREFLLIVITLSSISIAPSSQQPHRMHRPKSYHLSVVGDLAGGSTLFMAHRSTREEAYLCTTPRTESRERKYICRLHLSRSSLYKQSKKPPKGRLRSSPKPLRMEDFPEGATALKIDPEEAKFVGLADIIKPDMEVVDISDLTSDQQDMGMFPQGPELSLAEQHHSQDVDEKQPDSVLRAPGPFNDTADIWKMKMIIDIMQKSLNGKQIQPVNTAPKSRPVANSGGLGDLQSMTMAEMKAMAREQQERQLMRAMTGNDDNVVCKVVPYHACYRIMKDGSLRKLRKSPINIFRVYRRRK